MNINENKIYKTSDLALSAYLAVTFPVLKIEKDNDKRALFLFGSSNAIEELIKKYWDKSATVNPLDYYYSLKNLKARLYSEV